MEQFNIGDTVVMKSGGPIMTVVELNVGNDNLVACRWYESKKFLIDYFPAAALRLANDSDSGIGVA
jgi:uncharacterized protein YodC (DUF2158 family)